MEQPVTTVHVKQPGGGNAAIAVAEFEQFSAAWMKFQAEALGVSPRERERNSAYVAFRAAWVARAALELGRIACGSIEHVTLEGAEHETIGEVSVDG